MQKSKFEIINEKSQCPIILTCEHASNLIPNKYNNLGLDNKYFDTHIARDKGCKEVTIMLAKKIGATAFIGGFSRLLIDLNRKENEAEIILDESDKVFIPGNKNLSSEEKEFRLNEYYRPYHQAIDKKIDELKKTGIEPIVLSIHAYTSQLQGGIFRPWNIGILYINETPFTKIIIENISKIKNLTVGYNEPYDLRKYKTGSTVIHGYNKNIDNCLIEIRDTEFENINFGVKKWVDILYKAIKEKAL